MKAETRIADKEGCLEGWTLACRHQHTSTLNLLLVATMGNYHYIDDNATRDELEMAGVSPPARIRPGLRYASGAVLTNQLPSQDPTDCHEQRQQHEYRSKLLSGLWASDDENCANRSFDVLEQAGFVTAEKVGVCEPASSACTG